MPCKDVCKSEIFIESYSVVSTLKYIKGKGVNDGYKRCSTCHIYTKDTGLRCICCHNKYKVSNRNSAARQRASVNLHRY